VARLGASARLSGGYRCRPDCVVDILATIGASMTSCHIGSRSWRANTNTPRPLLGLTVCAGRGNFLRQVCSKPEKARAALSVFPAANYCRESVLMIQRGPPSIQMESHGRALSAKVPRLLSLNLRQTCTGTLGRPVRRWLTAAHCVFQSPHAAQTSRRESLHFSDRLRW